MKNQHYNFPINDELKIKALIQNFITTICETNIKQNEDFDYHLIDKESI